LVIVFFILPLTLSSVITALRSKLSVTSFTLVPLLNKFGLTSNASFTFVTLSPFTKLSFPGHLAIPDFLGENTAIVYKLVMRWLSILCG
jgi:hypothetical protein